MTGSKCLVCQEHSGGVPVPGGLLQNDRDVVAFHSPILAAEEDVYAGYLLVTSGRHVAGFADLTDDEAAAIGQAIARWSRALERAGADHVYLMRVGHGVAHLHVHLIPRWPGTPPDIPWTRVDEWAAQRGTFADAAAIAERIRTLAS